MRLLPPNTYAAEPAALRVGVELGGLGGALLFRFAGSLVKLYTARQR